MSKQEIKPKIIFISWSGPLGEVIARALKDIVLKGLGIESWISSENIEGGNLWFEEIEQAARICDAAIGCITPGATHSQWVNFEFGLIFGRLKNFKILLFEEVLSGPLAHIQAFDGARKEHLEQLLSSLLSENPQANIAFAKLHIDRVYPKWKKVVTEALRAHEGQIQLGKAAESLREAILQTSSANVVASNPCLQAILGSSLSHLRSDIIGIQDEYGSSQNEYPYHLVDVQKHCDAQVDAIALLQDEEQFWRRSIGRDIRDSAGKESRRVFVVRSAPQLEEHWDMLLSHAKAYKVFILSYDNFHRLIEDKFVRDFSIINIKGSKVVAAYDVTSDHPRILYSAGESLVAEYVSGYASVITLAVELSLRVPPSIETIRAKVFSSKALTDLPRRPIEMSAYIAVEQYDAHEEKHAYYVDMMKKMIKEFNDRFPDTGNDYRVLELGAGTGLFTKRLAQVGSISKLVALEIDWACYNRLYYRLTRLKNTVSVCNEDSRSFRPPGGPFHAVFSSFADHHIQPRDKTDYFANVRSNLTPHGLLIVGDEFLPFYDPLLEEMRIGALNSYHGHIIEFAEKAGESVLVHLESQALESGIKKIGDFKMSCTEYEHHLSENGFTVLSKERIGPRDEELAEQVGGVYVYVARVSDSSSE